MTPTTTQLQHRLDERKGWFRNQWLFKWHGIRDGRHPVQVDLFDGRQSYLGGMEFSGSARQIYWNAITRGVPKEIVEQFAWIDEQVRRYNRATAERAIDECAGLLISFARSIRRDAVEKDRILRGDGINFPPENDAGYWDGTSAEEIVAQASALKAALPQPPTEASAVAGKTIAARLNARWHANQWWAGPAGLLIGIVGLVALFV